MSRILLWLQFTPQLKYAFSYFISCYIASQRSFYSFLLLFTKRILYLCLNPLPHPEVTVKFNGTTACYLLAPLRKINTTPSRHVAINCTLEQSYEVINFKQCKSKFSNTSHLLIGKEKPHLQLTRRKSSNRLFN